jgi:O-acetylhomoserine/O-acetylserine sulfhydrylase-like pyridoxal-dependent enzyme
MEQHPITKVIRTRTDRTDEMEHSSPLFLTSSFCFDNSEEMRAAFADETDDNIYSRFSNPNVKELVDRVCLLEGAEAGYATASGMSAVFGSFMALMKQGDHLLSCSSIFGSTHTVITKFLPKYGIEYSYVPANKPEEWEAAIRPNTKMIYLETPTNPGLDIIDLEFISALAKKHSIILNVDNCFATPISQRPIDLGADLVVHSATKWMDGQGRVLGGVIVGKENVARFDVAMNEPLFLRRAQTARDLDPGVEHGGFRHAPLFRHPIVETSLIHQLHHEIELAVIGARRENLDDMRIVNGGGGARFLFQPRNLRRIGAQLGPKELQGDGTIQPRIPRFVN